MTKNKSNRKSPATKARRRSGGRNTLAGIERRLRGAHALCVRIEALFKTWLSTELLPDAHGGLMLAAQATHSAVSELGLAAVNIAELADSGYIPPKAAKPEIKEGARVWIRPRYEAEAAKDYGPEIQTMVVERVVSKRQALLRAMTSPKGSGLLGYWATRQLTTVQPERIEIRVGDKIVGRPEPSKAGGFDIEPPLASRIKPPRANRKPQESKTPNGEGAR